MTTEDLITLGSNTAKAGFCNEDAVVTKFNTWKSDVDAQRWLAIMGYKLKDIKRVEAIKLHGYKTDVQAKVTIFLNEAIAAENMSIKLVSNFRGFNQIDKRWVSNYVSLWNIPEDIALALKLFTGEIPHNQPNSTDSRRLLLSEMPHPIQKLVTDFFQENKFLVVSDIIKGRGLFSAGWMLVAQKSGSTSRWVLKNINEVMNHYGNGEVVITDRGSLKIGRITMQRKGGDNGRNTANMLQFKINPAELFNI